MAGYRVHMGGIHTNKAVPSREGELPRAKHELHWSKEDYVPRV